MDVVAMYDYYFFDRPHRKHSAGCVFDLCEKSILYRRLSAPLRDPSFGDNAVVRDVIEYMLYNVSGETGLPSYYSCCMSFSGGHVCNAVPIMIGSKLERRVVRRLCDELGYDFGRLYDADYLHDVYAGTFLVNGTFYYSVFRESNNNKIMHNTKSKFRGAETVCYFYDNRFNRGIKLYTRADGALRVNDRDGNEIADVTREVIDQLYRECLVRPDAYTLDMTAISGLFAAAKREGFAGIDMFKNKLYTNYAIGLNTFLDKLHPSAMNYPMWNNSLMVGKINLGISQRLSYPKSKNEAKKQNEQKLKMCTGGAATGYLVESQRRRNLRKARSSAPATTVTTESGSASAAARQDRRGHASGPGHTVLGSNEVKTVGLMDKLENGEKTGPSIFNQVSVAYLPFVRLLSATVQKLQVEHVHAESSKTVPDDAFGFVCMKYMGNISTAGKNMLFTGRTRVSYGHVHAVVAAVESGLERLASAAAAADRFVTADADRERAPTPVAGGYRVVVNNAVTVYTLDADRLVDFALYAKTECSRFCWLKVVGRYACLYYYEGVAMIGFGRDEYMIKRLYSIAGPSGRRVLDGLLAAADGDGGDPLPERLLFTRHEIESLSTTGEGGTADRVNAFVSRAVHRCRGPPPLAGGPFPPDADYESPSGCGLQSLLAAQLDQFTEYTPPAKRSVSVNARKSSCANAFYQRAADLIRGFNVFTDPDRYERRVAEMAEAAHGVPRRVTASLFASMRADTDNRPASSHPSVNNFYMLRTAFADIAGRNVEDANVIDASVDLCLAFSYSFSLTFVDRTARGVDVLVPDPRKSAQVCAYNAGDGAPSAVLFLVCVIRGGEADRSTDDDGVQFPPFRKMCVHRDSDGSYHVYYVRTDEVLLRGVRRRYERRRAEAAAAGETCYREPDVCDALESVETRVTRFAVNGAERVVTVDTRVHGLADKYEGIKVVNSFGQKGLARVADLSGYVAQTAPVPLQLIMNVCSFVSREPIGQHVQMRRNAYQETESAAGEPVATGYTAVFFTESEPTTKTCLVRMDEMMRSVIVTLGLSCFQNVKSSVDNVYNMRGTMCPPHTRQILDLYPCFGVKYRVAGDSHCSFATRADVREVMARYDEYTERCRDLSAHTRDGVLLEILDVVRGAARPRPVRQSRSRRAGERSSPVRVDAGTAAAKRVIEIEWPPPPPTTTSTTVEREHATGDRLAEDDRARCTLRLYDPAERTETELRVIGEPYAALSALKRGRTRGAGSAPRRREPAAKKKRSTAHPDASSASTDFRLDTGFNSLSNRFSKPPNRETMPRTDSSSRRR